MAAETPLLFFFILILIFIRNDAVETATTRKPLRRE